MFSADHAGKSFFHACKIENMAANSNLAPTFPVFHACKMAEHGGSAPKQGAMCDLEPMFLPFHAVAAVFAG